MKVKQLHIFQQFCFETNLNKHSQSYRRQLRQDQYRVFDEKEELYLLFIKCFVNLIYFLLELQYNQNCDILLHVIAFLNMQYHLFEFFSSTFLIIFIIIFAN